MLHVVAGVNHVCAILDKYELKCWGQNGSGQLGLENITNLGNSPGQMGDALPVVNVGTGVKVLQVALSSLHTCALLDDSSVRCWGLNDKGQLGIGNLVKIGDEVGEMGNALAAVGLGTGKKALQLATGAKHACAVLDDGSMKCWGSKNFGELGVGSMSAMGDAPGEINEGLPIILLGTGK